MKKTINVYGRTPYTMSEEKFEEVAEALAMIMQQLILPYHMYGVMNLNMSKIRDVVNNYFPVEALVKHNFLHFTKKQTLRSLNYLVDSFAAEYSLRTFNKPNLFLSLEERFLSSEELETNKHKLCGYS